MTSKYTNEIDKSDSKKVKTKNSLRVDDTDDVNPSNGRDIIEQAFFRQ